MTPFGSDFIHGSYHAFTDCTPAVTLGDNATKLSILGRGSIERWVEVAPNQFKSITLSSVLHVRGIQRRFMSPGRLNEKGWTATLPPSERFPVRKGTNACFYGRRIGTLFHVHAYAEPPPGSTTLNTVQALPIKIWHERMGHTHWEALKRTRTDSPPLRGIKLDSSEPPKHTCPGCAAGKHKRRAFKSSSPESRATEPLERIHADLMGPMDTAAVSGKWRYSLVITDDYSRHAWTCHLTSKDQTAAKFKSWVPMIQKKLGRRIGYFRSDRGGEFMSAEFSTILEEYGITRETSAPYTPQQNGLAERMNQTLVGGARAMLQHSGLSRGFWAEALDTATHVFNRAPRKGLGWRTPYELLFGRIPDVSHLRVFGCSVWVHQEKGKKWDPNSKAMVFIGYEPGSKAYRIWNPESRSVVLLLTGRGPRRQFPAGERV